MVLGFLLESFLSYLLKGGCDLGYDTISWVWQACGWCWVGWCVCVRFHRCGRRGVVLPPVVVVVCCVWWGVFLAREDVAGWGEWVGVLRFGHPSGEGGR